MGHRVGFGGYTGAHIENTISAVQALAAADAAGKYTNSHFPFIEFDVRETKDGELVLIHDQGLRLAFPMGDGDFDDELRNSGSSKTALNINAEPFKVLAEQGIDRRKAFIEDLTLEQLQTLHLGGREGHHVPTLQSFLE